MICCYFFVDLLLLYKYNIISCLRKIKKIDFLYSTEFVQYNAKLWFSLKAELILD